MSALVGLVVVSHSRALADGVVALAREMAPGELAIEVAAGLDETTFGTDAVAIAAAIGAADSGAGVVVLMDLGSAVLSAELALDLLDDPDDRERVLLCPAPLVEGLVVAAVTAAGGADREEVAAEAAAALGGKQAQLGGPSDARPAMAGDAGATAEFTVANPHGLHARPAARLAALVRSMDGTEVRVRNATTGSDWIPAASLAGLTALGALSGHRVEVGATGPGAGAALEAVLGLASRHFDEPLTAPPPQPVAHPSGGGPLPASPGIGIGPKRGVEPPAPVVPDEPAADPAVERDRLDAALPAVAAEIRAGRDVAARELGKEEAAIFDAHLLLLDDPALLADARSEIAAGAAAPRAWADAAERVAAAWEAVPDPYLAARAADVRAVSAQVLRVLVGGPALVQPDDGGPAAVLVARDLTPAQAAALDPERVAGVVLAGGSATAHSAILLRARGVPAIVAAGAGVLDVPDGTPVVLDGAAGELVVDPQPEVLATFRERATARAEREARARRQAAAPAATRDGVGVLVGANVGSTADAAEATASGADLVGLLRTEFLFLGRTEAPDVDEQEAAYREVAAALGGRRVTLRTLDVGGDKPLPYLPLPAEANPFLGLRGIRLAEGFPGLLADQLLAAVRVAHETPMSVMFPMVAALDELIAARRALDAAIAADGRGTPPGLQVGIMVEVPATALKAAAFVPHVDFFSIGTNDLTQYAMAAERGNPALAALADPLDPGVLRLVDAVCRAAGDQTLVAVCGEAAADPLAAELLVGLGVRELSTAPPAVPATKQTVRELDAAQAALRAAEALTADGPATVRHNP
ncbi:phosphoenolpyruvate--protein phosphotransferase [Pseudonocardia sp. DSM 110487]|uniref:phosphoenolpyruvate--protein phosphotransferase n=1 Tax=Pseudonocardia sp. DSM 110487 TaxID=2865833 RepID=UPI001C69F128|nr:phosphoenolpyruvate--protein phosphotransferase [Pseudonocardia sp. DSM 110487]QYN38374.1 phosphoenolpyruvate--protein phosphotransferase [Pseudonocardia sp. DSM 110487]